MVTGRERVSEPVRRERVEFDPGTTPDPSEGAR
ncbi:MAG: hypothetical protein AVDCRST_MAG30-4308 [uncultured Solirubrobacteraceae bacterium]|uniref:Uncharacterized protein n=1 Tax=uncultured Solirubrobacteraceae bacterium TaxID=1162706 RepID=A0A6J4U324_9ACTN|nr:MAG: hypothetical protein AVDCRST_MAG30-4308 [uncultured Solirubrobacteraceae bacterium]